MGIANSIKTLGASNHTDEERQKEDFYATPGEAVDKVMEKIRELGIVLPENIIEPSVGDGAIASRLVSAGHSITAYDIIDRGWPGTIVADFLTVDERPESRIAIFANFPYGQIQKHTEKALSLLRDGEYLISLARLQFLESKSRRRLFDEQPPRYVLPFSERITCYKNGIDNGGSGAVCYAFYIWEKGFAGRPEIVWL